MTVLLNGVTPTTPLVVSRCTSPVIVVTKSHEPPSRNSYSDSVSKSKSKNSCNRSSDTIGSIVVVIGSSTWQIAK